MKRFLLAFCFLFPASFDASAFASPCEQEANKPMPPSVAAKQFLATLDESQAKKANLSLEDEKRMEWHFIPMETRKGVPLRDMNEKQIKAALELLRSVTSPVGFKRATDIMSFEGILLELEGPASVGRRDFKKYYFAIYGEPTDSGAWGLSIEGHHMSLNFTFSQGAIVDSTPQLFASNPAELPKEFSPPSITRMGETIQFPEGYRLIASEEDAGFALLNSLNDAQQSKAVFNETCPEDILWAGEPQPKPIPYVGISAKELDAHQKSLLRKTIETFLACQSQEVVQERLNAIAANDDETIHFAWAGSKTKQGACYFRVQGPTFIAEFCNFQADAAGKKANHVHCVWRDLTGDFNLPMTK
ncbi:MAG: DUF3500 domain-containing protein [Pirellula sp.]|jgi:hypothetical protein|nr:DUF3500 domain-containing protein [Pirellula sp.]